MEEQCNHLGKAVNVQNTTIRLLIEQKKPKLSRQNRKKLAITETSAFEQNHKCKHLKRGSVGMNYKTHNVNITRIYLQDYNTLKPPKCETQVHTW